MKLSARDRRAALIGAVALGAGVAWSLAVAPYVAAVRDATARLEVERQVLARELGIIAEAARYRADATESTAEFMRAATRLFGGGGQEVAAANLAQYLRGVAEVCRVFLRRVDLGAPAPAGTGLVALPVHVAGESDLEGILSLLHALEYGGKLVRVDSLRVTLPRRGAVAADGEPEVLEFAFTATGYLLESAEQEDKGS